MDGSILHYDDVLSREFPVENCSPGYFGDLLSTSLESDLSLLNESTSALTIHPPEDSCPSPASNLEPYTRELKVDKRILEVMQRGGDKKGHVPVPSAEEFFTPLQRMGVDIDFSASFHDRQGNEIPIVKVSSYEEKNLEYACAKIMQSLDPHRDKMTFNIDVPSSDHSFIIGKDGVRIKQLSRDTHCHIHLPDCNKALGKKSNKISIAGTTFNNIERARDSIRKNLPLNIQFCLEVNSNKISLLDSSSSEVQSIKRRHMVDVNFYGLNILSLHGAQPGSVTCAVKGNRSQLPAIGYAIADIFKLAYGIDFYNEALEFEISIDISHIHHQYVRGKNNCNLKVIHQRCGANIIFPTDKSNIVRIQSRNISNVVLGWQEIMGYLPLMLSFDLNMEEDLIREYAFVLEKKHSISIRHRVKLASTIFTLFIKTQERHSLCLNEIREQFLALKKNPILKQLSVPNTSFLQDVLPSCSPSSYPISEQTINTFTFPVENEVAIPTSLAREPVITPPRMFGNDVSNIDRSLSAFSLNGAEPVALHSNISFAPQMRQQLGNNLGSNYTPRHYSRRHGSPIGARPQMNTSITENPFRHTFDTDQMRSLWSSRPSPSLWSYDHMSNYNPEPAESSERLNLRNVYPGF